ncbi:transposase [Roseimarinus sediminis]|uniref:transposase n=1 Tax=Roseimarinus sediminis TaxID=1610899 RepID=UPI003D232901
MLRRSKSILGHNNFTALYDKGYHTGSELAISDSLAIPAIVAIPPLAGASHAPNPAYDVEHFIYSKEDDTYTCPQGHVLTTNNTWHHAKNSMGEVSYRFKNYTTRECKRCEVREQCTKSAANGKQVRRSEYTENIENNKKRVEKSEQLYKRRQAIVEHLPKQVRDRLFGTIKRQWGFNYIITKKYIERAEADFGLVMTAYKLRRIINIVGIEVLIKYLAGFALSFGLKEAIKELKSNILSQLINKTNINHYFVRAA